jgi:hypothetical protein
VVDLLSFEQLVIQALPAWLANGIEVQVDHPPRDRSKRSISVTLRGSATEINLGGTVRKTVDLVWSE